MLAFFGVLWYYIRMTERNTRNDINESSPKSPNYVARRIGAGTIAALLLAGGVKLGIEIVDVSDGIEYPEGTTEYTIKPGDTLWDIAQDEVKNSNSVRTDELYLQIMNDPANIDVMFDENGSTIVPGDVIVIPVSVEQ